jgi:hypothetical protein
MLATDLLRWFMPQISLRPHQASPPRCSTRRREPRPRLPVLNNVVVIAALLALPDRQ